MQDQRLDLDGTALLRLLGRADQNVGHQFTSSMQAAMVTITSALALQNSPLLISAMPTIFCVSASLMRVPTTALPLRGPSDALNTCGCGFFSLKTWIAFTWSASVIGLSTDTVSGTVLPFSISGGMSSLMRPGRSTAPPVTSLIIASRSAGVACAEPSGRSVTRAAPATKARRSRPRFFISVLQGHKIGHDILDLLGAQDRLTGEALGHALQPIQSIIGWHDRVSI